MYMIYDSYLLNSIHFLLIHQSLAIHFMYPCDLMDVLYKNILLQIL